jgi:hypothetical protein
VERPSFNSGSRFRLSTSSDIWGGGIPGSRARLLSDLNQTLPSEARKRDIGFVDQMPLPLNSGKPPGLTTETGTGPRSHCHRVPCLPWRGTPQLCWRRKPLSSAKPGSTASSRKSRPAAPSAAAGSATEWRAAQNDRLPSAQARRSHQPTVQPRATTGREINLGLSSGSFGRLHMVDDEYVFSRPDSTRNDEAPRI